MRCADLCEWMKLHRLCYWLITEQKTLPDDSRAFEYTISPRAQGLVYKGSIGLDAKHASQ